MKLLFMFGNAAVGKMTVGQELAKITGLRLIFTYMWAFDRQSDWDYVEYVKNIFMPYDTEFYYVELVASREVRLKRNATDNRLLNKASKRNVPVSNQRLIDDDKKYRLESMDGEIPFENYMKIDNTNLAPDVVAQMIKNQFDL